jgi:hypothetical protein
MVRNFQSCKKMMKMTIVAIGAIGIDIGMLTAAFVGKAN